MIKLSNITPIEFDKYKKIFIQEEAIELIQMYKHTSDQADIKAKDEFSRYFPKGNIKKNEYLQSINSSQLSNKKTLGYLWYSISDDYVFILDFYIHNEFRSKGYGSQTLEKLQKVALKNNKHQIRLRVAHHNTRALKLYQELGFTATGTNMVKWL